MIKAIVGIKNPKVTHTSASSHLGHRLVNLQARPQACVCVSASFSSVIHLLAGVCDISC